MTYIQKDDIQYKIDLEDVGGVDWYDFPQEASHISNLEILEVGDPLMNDSYWVWKTAVLLANNDLDRVYRPSTDCNYIIAEFTIDGSMTRVRLGNINWDSIEDSPVGFFEIDDKEVYSEGREA